MFTNCGIIEIDGFPSDSLDNTRLVSFEPNFDSFHSDEFQEYLLRNCILAINEPEKVKTDEKSQLLQELERCLSNNRDRINSDLANLRQTSSARKGVHVPPIKLKVEIPVKVLKTNQLKVMLDQPFYDKEKASWLTEMNFITTSSSLSVDIDPEKTPKETKSVQTEFSSTETESLMSIIPKEWEIKSKITAGDPDTVVIKTMENLENELNNYNFETSKAYYVPYFNQYKRATVNMLQKCLQETRKMKKELDHLLDFSNASISDAQFQNVIRTFQLLITTEENANQIMTEISREDLNVKNMFRFPKVAHGAGKRMKEFRYSATTCLIKQVIELMKKQTPVLSNEMLEGKGAVSKKK